MKSFVTVAVGFLILAVGSPGAAGAAEVGGKVTTVAGTGVAGNAGDGGPVRAAQLEDPFGLVRGPDGALWFCDYAAHLVRRIDRAGVITTFAGTGKAGPTPPDAPIAGTPLNGPRSLDFDAAGNLWLVTREGNQVLGTGQRGDGPDGDPLQTRLARPPGIFVEADGTVLIGDSENHRIRSLSRP